MELPEALKKLPHGKLGLLCHNLVSLMQLGSLAYYHREAIRQDVSMVREIWHDDRPWHFLPNPCYLLPNELFNLIQLARGQRRIPGDYAEVGVFLGASAKALCVGKGDKELHLFDTFRGLPNAGELDPGFRVGAYKGDLERIADKLGAFGTVTVSSTSQSEPWATPAGDKTGNINIYPGLFADTSAQIGRKRFALVHLDVDTYQSTFECLAFFHPRLSPGGIIVSHDCHEMGVKRAFEEFFRERSEPITWFAESQCLTRAWGAGDQSDDRGSQA